jgi:APA family basic amino acid/polyamine antiporter
MSAHDSHSDPIGLPRQQLSLIDSTSIIVGIIIGSAIYEISPLVAAGATGWAAGYVSPHWQATAGLVATMGVWVLGGAIALLGAMCYAELATAFPLAGGTYVFLSKAFGKSMGFAFAWTEFWIVRPGNVGAVAFVLARYGRQLLPQAAHNIPYVELLLAAGAILALSAVNAVGLRAGKWTQNVLTAAKLAGLVAIILAALTVPATNATASVSPGQGPGISLALILVMFAYGGWADMSFVAAEVRDPGRNIFRALLLGTATVTTIYLAANQAFFVALGLGGLIRSDAVAADVLSQRLGPIGSIVISLLVVISCLGAVNGMIFTGARVFYALGRQHPFFRPLGAWNERTGVPVRSLAVQTAITLGLVIVFGIVPNAFSALVVFTGPFYWGFFSLVGVALIVLRVRGQTSHSTYRVPLFPFTPILFSLTSGAMTLAALQYLYAQRAWTEFWPTAWATCVVVLGAVVGIAEWHSRRAQQHG